MTPQVVVILTTLLRATTGELGDEPMKHGMYAYELSNATGIPTGTIHPILKRLVKRGYAHDTWREIQSRRRRYYRLSNQGRMQATAAKQIYRYVVPSKTRSVTEGTDR